MFLFAGASFFGYRQLKNVVFNPITSNTTKNSDLENYYQKNGELVEEKLDNDYEEKFVSQQVLVNEFFYSPDAVSNPSNEKKLTGKLIKQNAFLNLEGHATFVLETKDGEQKEVIYYDLLPVGECNNPQASIISYLSKTGEEIEVFGLTRSEDEISICESQRYYVKNITRNIDAILITIFNTELPSCEEVNISEFEITPLLDQKMSEIAKEYKVDFVEEVQNNIFLLRESVARVQVELECRFLPPGFYKS